MAEVMSRAAPYLPGNRPDALHHLPSDAVDRLLDTHFRLLRHDLMNPLFENMQSMEREAGMSVTYMPGGHKNVMLTVKPAMLNPSAAFQLCT